MLTVADVMSSEVFTIRSSAKVTQAIALMQEKQVRSLVVEQAVKGGAYGIVTARDIVYKVMARSADPLRVMVCEIMDDSCTVIDPQMSLLEAAKMFADNKIYRAPIVSDSQLLGVLSITDIITRSNVETVELPSGWAEEAEVALRHKRLCWGEDCQLEEESATARQVLEGLRS